MAMTNRDRVGKALEVLSAGLVPFVERELKTVLGERWQEALADSGPRQGARRAAPKLTDPQVLVGVGGTSGTTLLAGRWARRSAAWSASCARCATAGPIMRRSMATTPTVHSTRLAGS
jgi:hypothetical protein